MTGNPGGRPKGIAALAREHKDKALSVLVEAMDDDDGRVRIAAAREILDRGFGKSVVMTADVSDKLDDMDDDAIDAALDAIRSVIKDRNASSEDAGKAQTH
jgi:hypothetical protein